MSREWLINEVLPYAIDVAYGASEIIMNVYHSGFEYEIKSDDSPVTIADKKADAFIRERISKKYCNHAFLTEESEDDKSRLNCKYIWIIDPLDGTKNFINRDGEFAINIALVEGHTPVLGIVMIPNTGEMYYAVKDYGAYYVRSKGDKPTQISVSKKVKDLVLLTSVFHVNDEEIAVANKYREYIKEERKVGSAIKACLIARGLAEVSFRFNANTKEWDTCAPQIIVEEAGGFFTEPNGNPITYNRVDVYNRNGFSIYNLEENNYAKKYLENK